MISKNVAPAPQEQTSVRLYGILQDSPPGNSHISIQYCGFKTSTDEVRIGSARTFMIKAEHATQDGVVAGFDVDGQQIHAFEVSLDAEVLETTARKINLGVEIATSSGRTIGGLLSAKNLTRPQMEQWDTLPAAEQMEKIRQVMLRTESARGIEEVGAYCASIQQSYSWTSHWLLGPRPDPWGADCDDG